jgi:DNA-binding phage protein
MKKNKYDIDKMTFEEMKEAGLCELSKDDWHTTMAKSLVKHNEVKGYKKLIIKGYNETGDLGVFLEQLKTLAKAEEMSKKAKTKKTDICRFLSKDDKPSFENVKVAAVALGINLKMTATA